MLYLERAGWNRGAVIHDHTDIAKYERLESLMDGMKELDYQRKRSKELGETYADLLARCLDESQGMERKEALAKQGQALAKQLVAQQMQANVAE